MHALRFLHSACSLMLVDCCMKVYDIKFEGFSTYKSGHC